MGASTSRKEARKQQKKAEQTENGTHSNMYRRDTKTIWTNSMIQQYQEELKQELQRQSKSEILPNDDVNNNNNNKNKNKNIFSCCMSTSNKEEEEEIEQKEVELIAEEAAAEEAEAGPAIKIIDINMNEKGDNYRDSSNDLNVAVVDTTNAFLELLQLDTMNQHLQEMRDRRMFLEKAAHDKDLPAEEREIAAWITDTYLSKSPTINYPQSILENIINKQHIININKEQEQQQQLQQENKAAKIRSEKLQCLNESELKAIIVQINSKEDDFVCNLLLNINEWNFSVFEFVEHCGDSSLSLLMVTICKWRHITHQLNINESILIKYMNYVDTNYLKNPYHNHIHAADVLLNIFYFMKSWIFLENIDILDSFAILIAASVHDIGHPGHGNSFEINTESELAIRYNDQSILENMHICLAWNLLSADGDETNILNSFNKTQKKRFRKVLIDSVLATDMSQHSLHSETLEKLIEKYENKNNSKIEIAQELRVKFSNEFLPIALHTADLGNLCKEIKYYSEWVDRLMEEFFNQGDKERELGIEPITFLCDRFKVNIHSGQVGFINFVIRPWFIKFGRLLYEESHNKLFLSLLNDNLLYMQERANQTKDAQEEIKKQEQVLNILPVVDDNNDIDMQLDEMNDVLHPLPSKPKIIDIEHEQKDDDIATRDAGNSRTSKSYSIVGISFPEMKSKLREWKNEDVMTDEL